MYRDTVLELDATKISIAKNAINSSISKGNINLYKTLNIPIQVTAYTPNTGGRFADGTVMAAAVSPILELEYGVHLGDIVYIKSRSGDMNFICKIVDRTSQDESRPVIDILFKDKKMARDFGRKNLYIVNKIR